jgi:hypothetical protein
VVISDDWLLVAFEDLPPVFRKREKLVCLACLLEFVDKLNGWNPLPVDLDLAFAVYDADFIAASRDFNDVLHAFWFGENVSVSGLVRLLFRHREEIRKASFPPAVGQSELSIHTRRLGRERRLCGSRGHGATAGSDRQRCSTPTHARTQSELAWKNRNCPRKKKLPVVSISS